MKQTQEHPLCPQCKEPGLLEDGSPASFCLQCRFPLMAIAGKYRLQKRLARGGAGTVYLARHLHLDDAYARVIKVLEMSEVDETTTRRFFREVQVTARAANASDHIVRIYDDFGHEPFLGYYYVMEYLQGEDLSVRLHRDGAFALHDAIALFAQLCEAMSAAHDVGVVHRDLKPENILLVRKGESEIVKVIDFGIARKMNTQQLTDPSRALIGTPMYMSPEQCLNQHVDHRSDIYAMGLLLFELLTGGSPFAMAIDNPDNALMSVMYAHINTQPPRMSELRPDLAIPESLEEVVATAIAKQPEQRYASVEHLSEALIQALNPAEADEFDSRSTIPDGFEMPDFLKQIQASYAQQDGHTEIDLAAFSTPQDTSEEHGLLYSLHEESGEYTSPILTSWPDTNEVEGIALNYLDTGENIDEQYYAELGVGTDEIYHSLDVLPDAKPERPNTPAQEPHRRTPSLAASFPLNPLPAQQTIPAPTLPSTVEQEQMLLDAEALADAIHTPKGGQNLQALESMASALWSLHDDWHGRDPAKAIRVLLSLFPVVQASGDIQRFVISLRGLLKQPGLLAPSLRLKALLCQSQCHKHLGQTEDAARLLEDTLAMTVTRDEPKQKGHLLNLLGSVYRQLGKREEARSLHQEALSLLQQHEELRGVAQARRHLANIARIMGSMEEAESHLRASLQLCREIGDVLGQGETLAFFGNLHRSEGRKADAEEAYSDAVKLYQEIGDHRGLAITQSNLGHVLMKQGHLLRAAKHYSAALEVFRLRKDIRSEAIALGHLGELHRRLGELQQAKEYHETAMSLHRQLGDRRGEAISFNHLGTTLRDEGRLHDAEEHHRQAATHQEHMQDKRGMGLTRFHQGLVQLELNRLNEANERFDQAAPLLIESKSRDGQCELLLYRGILYHLAGGIAAASECYNRALELSEELRDLHLEARVLFFWIILESHRKDTAKAEAAFARASNLVGQLGSYMEPILDISEACIALARIQQHEAKGTQPQVAWELADEELARSTDHRLAQRLLKGALNRKRTHGDSAK